MSTKKKTKTAPKTKRSPEWKEYFSVALSSATRQAFDRTVDDTDLDAESSDTTLTFEAAKAVKLAEKIADIATGRNA